MRKHNQEWLEQNAVFGCSNLDCAVETSYHAEDLKVTPAGNPVCNFCWDESRSEDEPAFYELSPFNPFKEI